MSHRRRRPDEPRYVPAREAFVRDEEAERQTEEALRVYEQLAGIRIPHPGLYRRLLQLIRSSAFADQICKNAYVKQEALEVLIAITLKAVLLGQMFESQKEQIISELKEVCMRRESRAQTPAAHTKKASSSRPQVMLRHRASHGSGGNLMLSPKLRKEAARAASKKNQFVPTTCMYSGCGRSFATDAELPQAFCSKKCEHLEFGDGGGDRALPPERLVTGWDWAKEGISSEGETPRPEAWTSRYTASPKQKCEFCKRTFYADRPQRFCSKDCVQANAEEKRG